MKNIKIYTESKLIAEFMGGAVSEDGLRVNIPISDNDSRIFNIYGSPTTFDKGITRTIYLSDTKYHSDWNWLMPVVTKLKDIRYSGELIDNDVSVDLSFRLNDTLLETNLDSLYSIVVEFINEYNKTI